MKTKKEIAQVLEDSGLFDRYDLGKFWEGSEGQTETKELLTADQSEAILAKMELQVVSFAGTYWLVEDLTHPDSQPTRLDEVFNELVVIGSESCTERLNEALAYLCQNKLEELTKAMGTK